MLKNLGMPLEAIGGLKIRYTGCWNIAFREDESRIRKGSAPENFAAIRHIALSLLRNNKTFKGSIKTKRLNAAMDKKYLENVMFS